MSDPFLAVSPSFSPIPLPAKAAPVAALARTIDGQDLERIRRAVEAVGEIVYHWVIETDELRWSGDAAAVLGCPAGSVATGKAFATNLDIDNFTTRYDAVMRTHAADDGEGVPFQIEYLFRPEGRLGKSALWLEDSGRWFRGRNGKPAEVFGVVRRIDDRHKRDQQLRFLGNCDPLTGMMNRGRMAEALGEAITVASREGTACAFVIAGISNLAVVIDAYGFEIADEVIIAVGRRLRQVVRGGDAIARYSGSKFGIILNNCSPDDLQIAAERFLSVARESVIETERGPVWAMLSIGGLLLPVNAGDANTAMARAEEALTEAKRLPSDGFSLYQPSQRRVSERGLNARCATEIVACLKEDRFKLAYQPIVDATTNEVVMHEALLRMADREGEMIAAAHLIPIAEKLGLVRLIDRTVVQMVIGTLLKYPSSRLSFNVSGITATDPRWFSQLTEILSVHREVNPRLTVEITETVALSDLEETARFTTTLRDLGCLVAIDDFGAGYTSFRNLKALNVDILKLDGSFCEGLQQNPDNQYFVRSLVDLAKKFELKTVAEWVQTPEDADYLRGWGVDYLQGNLYGAAVIAEPWAPSPGAGQAFVIEPAAFTRREPEHPPVQMADPPALRPSLAASPPPVAVSPEPIAIEVPPIFVEPPKPAPRPPDAIKAPAAEAPEQPSDLTKLLAAIDALSFSL